VTRSTAPAVDAGRAQECELFKEEIKLKTYLKKNVRQTQAREFGE
jgi:hypothetical protein